jgi:hypothetical protein
MSINTLRDVSSELLTNSYVIMSSDDFSINPTLIEAKQELWSEWNDLLPDNYLKNNGHFRFRRFANFYFQPDIQEILPLPHIPYFQEKKLNSYAGGLQREFAQLKESTLENPFLHELIKFNFRQFPLDDGMTEEVWHVDVHLIRIVASPDEVGEPTPEGIHHDENDFICMHLAKRQNTTGGINTIYTNDRSPLQSSTLNNPMDSVIIWDPRVMHGVSPIMPQDPTQLAVRDMLLIGYNYRPELERPNDRKIQ